MVPRNETATPLWMLGLMLLVLNVPNLMPWERSYYPDTYVFDLVERLLKSVLFAILFLSLFARPWVAWLVAWFLFLWWLPVSVGIRWLSDTPITSNMVGMALASSAGELMNLAVSLPWWATPMLLAWNVFCALILFWLRRRSAWRWPWRMRWQLAFVSGALLTIPVVSHWSGSAEATVSTLSPTIDSDVAGGGRDAFAEGDKLIATDGTLHLAYPYELPWALAQYWQARNVILKAREQLRRSPVLNWLHPGSLSPEVVVLVIGESSSRQEWRLFTSNAKPTTPRLSARLDQGQALFLFTDVVAQSTATRQAVPSMLTSQPLIWPDGRSNEHPALSILSEAAAADYATAWFSNQAAVGKFDGAIAAYAEEAAVRAFLNPASFTNRGTYDDVLLPPLRKHVSNHSRALVVLHTMGSHFKFSHRYPPGFGSFGSDEDLTDTYRNSIEFTDQFLDSVMSELESTGRSAVLVYVSDHGQGLPEAQCNKPEINRVTAVAYEVPALVWLSPKFLSAFPTIGEILQGNQSHPYTTGAVYQTLRDLIESNGGATKAGNHDRESFLRAPGVVAPQMVVSPDQRWTDFKAAATRSPCFIGVN